MAGGISLGTTQFLFPLGELFIIQKHGPSRYHIAGENTATEYGRGAHQPTDQGHRPKETKPDYGQKYAFRGTDLRDIRDYLGTLWYSHEGDVVIKKKQM